MPGGAELTMLTDRYNRKHDYLRISLTDACNLNCSYCSPASELRCTNRLRLMSPVEIENVISAFVSEGIRKIRLTGGEPLMRNDFADILQRIRRCAGQETELALTSNGVLIHRYIDALKDADVQSVNISLDTLLPERFEKITGHNLFHRVMSNIHLLLHNNFRLKINVVVMRGFNDDELTEFVSWTRDFPVEVRFIEFMPFQNNLWSQRQVMKKAEMMKQIDRYFETTDCKVEHDSTSSDHCKVVGYEGSFSFISTISNPFCGSCSRLRVSADGKMRNCLFAKGETDLAQAIRTGGDLSDLIHRSVLNKEFQWGGQELNNSAVLHEMKMIGG